MGALFSWETVVRGAERCVSSANTVTAFYRGRQKAATFFCNHDKNVM
jgi:hypothetical protein